MAFEVLAYKSELAQELIETASRAYAAGSVDSVHAAKPCIFLSNNPSFDPARASPEERRQWPPFPAQPRYNSPNAITMPLGRLPDLCTAAWTAAANLSGALDVGQWDDDLAWAASAALCSTRAGLAEAPYDHLMLHRVEAPEVSCDVSQAPQTALDLITERVRAWERATAPERLDSTAALLRRMQEVVLRHVGHLVSDGRLRKGYLFRDYVATPLMAVVHLKSLLHYSLDQQEGMHEQALAILPDELAAKIREPNGLWYPTHAEAALIEAHFFGRRRVKQSAVEQSCAHLWALYYYHGRQQIVAWPGARLHDQVLLGHKEPATIPRWGPLRLGAVGSAFLGAEEKGDGHSRGQDQ